MRVCAFVFVFVLKKRIGMACVEWSGNGRRTERASLVLINQIEKKRKEKNENGRRRSRKQQL